MDAGADSIEQCGVMIEANEKGFFQHQKSYIDKLKGIVPKNSKARTSEKLTDIDQSILRGWCGEFSWHGVSTLPWVSAWVADIQSKIPDGDYELFGMANNVTKMVKANRTDGI